jgi:alpha-1,2-mannosyltransferase
VHAATPRADGPRLDAWMRPGRLRAHALLLALCLWGVLAAGLATPGLRDRSGLLKGADFLQFYVFGSLARDGRTEALYDYSAHVALAERRVPESRGTTFLPVYGPQVALFFAPLSVFAYGPALTLWVVASALLYALCVLAVWRTCPRLSPHGRTVALLALAYPPLFSLIGHGQTSALALASFTASWLALRGGHRFAAGLALGCLAYKPQLALGAGLVLLAVGEMRIVAGAVVAAAFQLAWGAFQTGSAATLGYATMLTSLGSLAPTLGFKLHQMHCLRAFFDLLLPGPVAKLAWAASALVALVLAIRIWRSALPLALRFAALLVATALVNPHQYMYDLVILAPAWLLLADAALARPAPPWAPLLRVLLYAAFVLPALGPLARVTHLQLSVLAMGAILVLLERVARKGAEGDAVSSRFSPRGEGLSPLPR